LQKKKENLLDKFVKKDYKNELEKMLEGKLFDEDAKSILLEILYKIEIAYKDYAQVKKDTYLKEEYIEKFIKAIQNNCELIKIIKPSTRQMDILKNRTFIVNKERKEIICLPIERKLLYSVAKISRKDNIVKDKYFLLGTTWSDLLNIGSSINAVEPLRDFNGWSWTTVAREIENLEYNLVFQNLQILIGTKLIECWLKNEHIEEDYYQTMCKELEIAYGKKLKNKIIKSVNRLSIFMELKVNEKLKNEIENLKQETIKELDKFENKQEYIELLSQKKEEYKDKIKNVDTVINNKHLLEKEYENRNSNLPLEKKIFSIRVLVDIMAEEREQYFSKLEECNDMMNPKKFIAKKRELEEKLSYYEIASVKDRDKELQKELIKFQEIFLQCFMEKIEKAESKKEIIDLIYRYRYYCLIPYDIDNEIYKVKELKKTIEEVCKKLIKKAVDNKVIAQISINEYINYEILKNIFYTRVIDLEELNIKITKENDKYLVQFFDENVFEQKKELIFDEKKDKKSMKLRTNKKIKIFKKV